MMKSIHIPLLFMLAFLSACNMQNNSKMQKALLKEGCENPVVRFGTLEIEPVNLFIHEPQDDQSPRIKVELWATEEGEEYHALLVQYEAVGRSELLIGIPRTPAEFGGG